MPPQARENREHEKFPITYSLIEKSQIPIKRKIDRKFEPLILICKFTIVYWISELKSPVLRNPQYIKYGRNKLTSCAS